VKPQDVRDILLTDWDPIDIGDNPYLADEYDSVIPKVLALIKKGATAEEIEAFLRFTEAEFGVVVEPSRSSRAARRLASM
jgi:hypothetical protein